MKTKQPMLFPYATPIQNTNILLNKNKSHFSELELKPVVVRYFVYFVKCYKFNIHT